MRRGLLIPILVIACCGAVAIGLWSWSRSQTSEEPFRTLAKEVRGSSAPAEVVKRAGQEAGGGYILSLGERATGSLRDEEVQVLEVIADEAVSTDSNALAQGRNAVMAAGYALANVAADDKMVPRLKAILLKASSHEAYRMRSTFVATCDARKSLLEDRDIRGAIGRLAASNDPNLKISERAGELLKSGLDSKPTTGPP